MAIQLRARSFHFLYQYLRLVGHLEGNNEPFLDSDVKSLLLETEGLPKLKDCEKLELIFQEILGYLARNGDSTPYKTLAYRLVREYVRHIPESSSVRFYNDHEYKKALKLIKRELIDA